MVRRSGPRHSCKPVFQREPRASGALCEADRGVLGGVQQNAQEEEEEQQKEKETIIHECRYMHGHMPYIRSILASIDAIQTVLYDTYNSMLLESTCAAYLSIPLEGTKVVQSQHTQTSIVVLVRERQSNEPQPQPPTTTTTASATTLFYFYHDYLYN